MEQLDQQSHEEPLAQVYQLIPKEAAIHETVHHNKAHETLKADLAERAIKITAFADIKQAYDLDELWSRDPNQRIVRGYN